jgi:succinoglycan biosynthesis transport protein ExoP
VPLRRARVPVLARSREGAASAWGSLRRSELDAYSEVLAELGEAATVLVSGGAASKGPVATGLATAAAVSGRRAVLVECDLANPRLARALGLTTAPGLHEYLRWASEAAQILQALVLAGPASEAVEAPLTCVVAGEPTSNGAVLLAAESFRQATERLRNAYELVVYAGPPLEEAQPAALVAAQADAAVAAVSAAEASGRSGRALRRSLRRLPVRTLGLVLCDEP